MHTRETRAASIARQRAAATELDLLVLARQADALLGDVELLLEDVRRIAMLIVRARSAAALATAAAAGASAPTRSEVAA